MGIPKFDIRTIRSVDTPEGLKVGELIEQLKTFPADYEVMIEVDQIDGDVIQLREIKTFENEQQVLGIVKLQGK